MDGMPIVLTEVVHYFPQLLPASAPVLPVSQCLLLPSVLAASDFYSMYLIITPSLWLGLIVITCAHTKRWNSWTDFHEIAFWRLTEIYGSTPVLD
jgi:hypothetical protein